MVAALPQPSTLELLERISPSAIARVAPIKPITQFRVTPAVTPRSGWLVIPRLRYAEPIGGVYTGCEHAYRIPAAVLRWTGDCISTNNTYLLAHNPGLGHPWLALRPGDVLYYGLDRWVVAWVDTRSSSNQTGAVTFQEGISLTLQTCVFPDASVIRIVRAHPG